MRYARLATHSQREREQGNRTTVREMRLLLLFSLHEISQQFFSYMAGPEKTDVLELLPTQTYPLTLLLACL